YVTKPFSPKELLARIKVILRRTESSAKSNDLISFDNIFEMNLNKYEVKVKGKKVDLTTTEFKILRLLSEKPGWVYSRDQLLDYLWGNDKIVVDRTIDVHIKNLREKLGSAGEYIKNIRGVGYKLEL
nr:response regulator transcription factor [Candidatus Cloacimonadota bacterium]